MLLQQTQLIKLNSQRAQTIKEILYHAQMVNLLMAFGLAKPRKSHLVSLVQADTLHIQHLHFSMKANQVTIQKRLLTLVKKQLLKLKNILLKTHIYTKISTLNTY